MSPCGPFTHNDYPPCSLDPEYSAACLGLEQDRLEVAPSYSDRCLSGREISESPESPCRLLNSHHTYALSEQWELKVEIIGTPSDVPNREIGHGLESVSYTHLDVYKRQPLVFG